jgi:hypothetical protein
MEKIIAPSGIFRTIVKVSLHFCAVCDGINFFRPNHNFFAPAFKEKQSGNNYFSKQKPAHSLPQERKVTKW